MTPYEAVGIAEGFIDAADEERVREAWQKLIETGLAWTLPGWFGRQAATLIREGVCHAAATASLCGQTNRPERKA